MILKKTENSLIFIVNGYYFSVAAARSVTCPTPSQRVHGNEGSRCGFVPVHGFKLGERREAPQRLKALRASVLRARQRVQVGAHSRKTNIEIPWIGGKWRSGGKRESEREIGGEEKRAGGEQGDWGKLARLMRETKRLTERTLRIWITKLIVNRT